MENTSDSDTWKAIIGLATIITALSFYKGIMYYGSINSFIGAINNLFSSIIQVTNLCFSVVANYRNLFLLIVFIAFSVFLLIFVIKLLSYLVINSIEIIRDYFYNRRFIKNEIIEIENLLATEAELDEQKLRLLIEKLRSKLTICKTSKKPKHFMPKLKKRIETCLPLLEKLKTKKFVDEMRNRKESLIRDVQDLDEDKRIKESYDEPNDYVIYCKLKADQKDVFKKDRLSKKQVHALEKYGFVQKNEYSIMEQKYFRYLIRPKSNHNPTHAFLVWEIQKLLKNIEGVSKIKEHLAVDADVTFKFKNRYYAIEVERGDLPRKKEQAKNIYINTKNTTINVNQTAKEEDDDSEFIVKYSDKNKTIYYNRIPYNQFDVVLNADFVEPRIQLYYTLKVRNTVTNLEKYNEIKEEKGKEKHKKDK